MYPRQRARMMLACTAITSVTNLAMNLGLPRWLGSGATFLIVGESAALVVEALAYWLFSKPHELERAVAASAFANTLSFSVGLWLLR
jgi:hypothetical protein